MATAQVSTASCSRTRLGIRSSWNSAPDGSARGAVGGTAKSRAAASSAFVADSVTRSSAVRLSAIARPAARPHAHADHAARPRLHGIRQPQRRGGRAQRTQHTDLLAALLDAPPHAVEDVEGDHHEHEPDERRHQQLLRAQRAVERLIEFPATCAPGSRRREAGRPAGPPTAARSVPSRNRLTSLMPYSSGTPPLVISSAVDSDVTAQWRSNSVKPLSNVPATISDATRAAGPPAGCRPVDQVHRDLVPVANAELRGPPPRRASGCRARAAPAPGRAARRTTARDRRRRPAPHAASSRAGNRRPAGRPSP